MSWKNGNSFHLHLPKWHSNGHDKIYLVVLEGIRYRVRQYLSPQRLGQKVILLLAQGLGLKVAIDVHSVHFQGILSDVSRMENVFSHPVNEFKLCLCLQFKI